MAIKFEGMTPLIQVFDMPRSLAFYRGVLGFDLVGDSGDGDNSSWVWLRCGDADLMLNDQYERGHRPEDPPPERTRWHDDLCLYFACPDVDAAYEYLLAAGLEPEPPKIALYGMRQLYVADPDGYNICFQWAAAPSP